MELKFNQIEYEKLIEQLAVKVAGYSFDHILCLARGGLPIGDAFSRIFKKPLSILSTSAYKNQKRDELNIGQYITGTDKLKGNLLIVDDMVDSGHTMVNVVQTIQEQFPEVKSIKVGVLWYKEQSYFEPDFYIDFIKGNPWIIQPFEHWDQVDINDLIARYSVKK